MGIVVKVGHVSDAVDQAVLLAKAGNVTALRDWVGKVGFNEAVATLAQKIDRKTGQPYGMERAKKIVGKLKGLSNQAGTLAPEHSYDAKERAMAKGRIRGSAFDRLQRDARDASDAATWAENEKKQGGIGAMLQDRDEIKNKRAAADAADARFQAHARRVLGSGGRKGEGSRGGHVIGHTKSGKPIYDSVLGARTTGWSVQDHADASKEHDKRGNLSASTFHRNRAAALAPDVQRARDAEINPEGWERRKPADFKPGDSFRHYGEGGLVEKKVHKVDAHPLDPMVTLHHDKGSDRVHQGAELEAKVRDGQTSAADVTPPHPDSPAARRRAAEAAAEKKPVTPQVSAMPGVTPLGVKPNEPSGTPPHPGSKKEATTPAAEPEGGTISYGSVPVGKFTTGGAAAETGSAAKPAYMLGHRVESASEGALSRAGKPPLTHEDLRNLDRPKFNEPISAYASVPKGARGTIHAVHHFKETPGGKHLPAAPEDATHHSYSVRWDTGRSSVLGAEHLRRAEGEEMTKSVAAFLTTMAACPHCRGGLNAGDKHCPDCGKTRVAKAAGDDEVSAAYGGKLETPGSKYTRAQELDAARADRRQVGLPGLPQPPRKPEQQSLFKGLLLSVLAALSGGRGLMRKAEQLALPGTEPKEPGKRGGKYYRTAQGKVRYGEQGHGIAGSGVRAIRASAVAPWAEKLAQKKIDEMHARIKEEDARGPSGSESGGVVGRTKSGKPILFQGITTAGMSDVHAANHGAFSPAEHREAAVVHRQIRDEHDKAQYDLSRQALEHRGRRLGKPYFKHSRDVGVEIRKMGAAKAYTAAKEASHAHDLHAAMHEHLARRKVREQSIGQTRSGKSVGADHLSRYSTGFSQQDHEDAAALHRARGNWRAESSHQGSAEVKVGGGNAGGRVGAA